jgi:ATP-dependent DNA helicase PIF1
VVIGDFLQLPPVSAQSFCFESKVWTALGLSEPDALRELTEVFRQQNRDFIELLNAVRVGDISNGVLSTLNSCCVERKPQPADGIIPTRLYCTNVDVDRENAMRLAELRSEEEAFDATDFLLHPVKSAVEKKALEDLADKKVGARITLKLGAQVMLTRNTASSWRSEGLANGQRGVVIRFVTEHVKGETVRLPGPPLCYTYCILYAN